jgi:hypothetical protein
MVAEGRAVATAREARASDVIQKVECPLKPGFEYTIRRVDRHHPRRPTDYTRGENHSIINWNEDPYEWTTELHDHRFWSNFQADWYISIIKDRKNPITSQLYIDWSNMQQKHDHVFHKVITKAQKLGIFDMLGMYREWNTELVTQFCSTAWRSGNGYESTINFSVEGHQFRLCITGLPTIFGLVDNDFHRPEIIIERTIVENELAPLYMPGNERNYGTTHGLIPMYTLFNIFHNTLTPKRGDTNIRGTTRNLLLAILDDQPPPCISTFF